jgi:hypothetical protein
MFDPGRVLEAILLSPFVVIIQNRQSGPYTGELDSLPGWVPATTVDCSAATAGWRAAAAWRRACADRQHPGPGLRRRGPAARPVRTGCRRTGPGERRNLEHCVGEAEQRDRRGFRCGHPAAASAKCRLSGVVPEADRKSRASAPVTAGAVASPTAWVPYPRCISLIAAICATRPERPCPVQNHIRPGTRSLATNRSKSRASTCAKVRLISPATTSTDPGGLLVVTGRTGTGDTYRNWCRSGTGTASEPVTQEVDPAWVTSPEVV